MKKLALITGAARGIGLGIAKCLAREACDIAVCDVHEEAGVAAALEEIRSLGADALYCRADVAEAEARRRMLADIRERFGALHVLVNNAGVAPEVRADILEATEESYDRVMGINLRGPYFLTQAVANWMVAQRRADAAFRGCIVNVSSGAVPKDRESITSGLMISSRRNVLSCSGRLEANWLRSSMSSRIMGRNVMLRLSFKVTSLGYSARSIEAAFPECSGRSMRHLLIG